MLKPITSSTRYIKMKEIKEGDVIIAQGTFMEVRPGKFGDTYIFQETDGEEVGLGASGQIKSLYTRGKLKIGCQYNIVFNGKVALKDGRTANDFAVGEYSNDIPPQYIEESQEEFEG
jgi:hypothetical protein